MRQRFGGGVFHRFAVRRPVRNRRALRLDERDKDDSQSNEMNSHTPNGVAKMLYSDYRPRPGRNFAKTRTLPPSFSPLALLDVRRPLAL